MKPALLIAGVAVLGAIGFYLIGDNEAPLEGAEVILTATTSGKSVSALEIADVAPPPEGYVKYENKQYGFSFYHTPESTIQEYDEGGGAATIVLEDKTRVRGLQIFVVPYAEDKISEERFLADVPSKVINNLEDTTVGYLKIPAVTFRSLDEHLGETREIWFIYKGHLYEITTFRGVGNWFIPIIQSWRFI